MSGTLKLTLVVRHPDTGAPVALIAGSDLPDWAVDLVDPADVDGENRRAKHEAPNDSIPPLSGKGSGEVPWRAYAARLEVPVDAGAKRDDVVEAIRKAGHPVEAEPAQ